MKELESIEVFEEEVILVGCKDISKDVASHLKSDRRLLIRQKPEKG